MGISKLTLFSNVWYLFLFYLGTPAILFSGTPKAVFIVTSCLDVLELDARNRGLATLKSEVEHKRFVQSVSKEHKSGVTFL